MARNPERSLIIGGDHMIFGATNGIACHNLKLRRRLLGLLEQEFGIETDPLALHSLTRLGEQFEREWVVEPDADLARQPLPPSLNRGHRMAPEHLPPGHAID